MVRLVMACFVLSLGVGVASPWVKPGGIDLICSVGGAIKFVPSTGEGPPLAVTSFALDCPLCNTPGSPPPAMPASVAPVPALAHALQATRAIHGVRLTAAPLPPRGPPISLVS